MAQKYGLFNSVGGSPAYGDSDIADMLSLITNNAGYVVGYKNELEVMAGAGFQAVVATGGAWLGDPPGWWYVNDETITLDIDAETEGYSRIDRVVLRLDRNSEVLSITVQVLKGTAAASGPVAPALTQNSTVYEVSLAQVLVVGGGTSVNVTDERNSPQCGRIVLNGTATDVEETDSFTIGFKHVGRSTKCNKATTITITIPDNSSISIAIGSEFVFYQYGTGQVVFAVSGSAILRSASSSDRIGSRYSPAGLKKIGINEWLLSY